MSPHTLSPAHCGEQQKESVGVNLKSACDACIVLQGWESKKNLLKNPENLSEFFYGAKTQIQERKSEKILDSQPCKLHHHRLRT